MPNNYFQSGYNNITLIRRPFKKMGETRQSSNIRSEKLGNFDLIPLETGVFFNKENQVFPVVDSTVVTIDSNGKHNGRIYLISDPDVGVLIPHIIKEGLSLYHYKSTSVDVDKIVNKATTINSFDNTRMQNDSTNSHYSVSGFIFVQPVFLKIVDSFYAYIPRYRINDDDIYFERIAADSIIGNNFTQDNSNIIDDVVISNQNIDNIKFKQFGIGKDGIELKNGLKYKLDKSGNAELNLGNIKSDSLSLVKKPVLAVQGETEVVNEVVERKLESFSYRKGDVLSGTAFSSLLSSILFDVFDEMKEDTGVYECTPQTIGGDVSIKEVSEQVTDVNEWFDFRLKYTITAQNPQLKVNDNTYPITFDGNTQATTVPAGYYFVKKVYNANLWLFQLNPTYQKINMFMKKVSNYDILLVKK